MPKLRLGIKLPKGGVKSTGPHRVKILEDKIIRDLDIESGKEVEFVRYILEEQGERKIYQTKIKNKQGELSYLIQRLAELSEGSEVILEMQRQGIKNYVSVTPLDNSQPIEVEDEMLNEPPE